MKPRTEQYSVVDPVQSSLDKEVIKNDKLNPVLRDKILSKISEIEAYFKNKVTKSYVVGSSLTYQHTPNCDIDVTLFVDENNDKLKKLNEQLKEKYNEKIFLNKHPVNFHFATGKLYKFKADAIYDLNKNNWVKKPEALSEDDVEEIIQECQNVKEFKEVLTEYTKLKNLLEKYKGDTESLDEIFQQTFKVNYLFEKIRDIRRKDFSKRKDPNIPSANFRCTNIIYKILTQYGLDNLSEQITAFIKSRAKF
jgi:hypothetical protein